MAARVLLQRTAAPLTATLLAGTVMAYPRLVHAEAPAEAHFAKRKPIYDDFETRLTSPYQPPHTAPSPASPTPTDASSSPSAAARPRRRPTPTDRLAAHVRTARLFLHQQAAAAEDGVNGALARAFDAEQAFTATVASLAPARQSGERLMPGAVYVLVASMAGSIVARNRGLVLRAAAPLAFGVAAAWAVLPVTAANVAALLWTYEQRVPALAGAHVRAREGVQKGVWFARVHAELAKRKVEETVRDARETVEGWVRKGN